MTKEIIKEVEVPAIEPVHTDKTTWTPTDNPDPMQQILQGMLTMQAQTNETLQKLSDKLDVLTTTPAESTPKTEEEMIREINSKKIIQRKMYKVMTIKSVIPLNGTDQQLHWDSFSNWWIVRGDTNKRFDSETEAKEFWESVAPGKYKLMTVTVPVPEWQEYKIRRPNITM